MDGRRFDAFARSLAGRASRRRTLGVVVAAVLAPLTAGAEPEPARCLANGKRCRQPEATEGHAKGKRKQHGKHHPRSCTKCCSRFGAAGANGKPRCSCKSVGIACDQPSQCCSGDCRNGNCTACPPNIVFCPDGCANLQTDPRHCGACDHACAAGQRCRAGSCGCDAQSCPRGCCAADATCQRGTSDHACGVGGLCVACADCTRCDGTSCVAAADGGCCNDGGGVCHGGLCVACDAGQRCQGGQCVCDATSCADGCCDGDACVVGDARSGLACGVGGNACHPCPVNETCTGGNCVCGRQGGSMAPFTCCPDGSAQCDEGGPLTDVETCDTLFTCPGGWTTCIGTDSGTCRACCPPGTTCDQAGGFCLQGSDAETAADTRRPHPANRRRGRRNRRR